MNVQDTVIYFDTDFSMLNTLLKETGCNRLFVLCDNRTVKCCFPLIKEMEMLSNVTLITISEGDEHKNFDTLKFIWDTLLENCATRRSLLLNLGGGMVSDIGGFAAATFKRGFSFINIPTTLLAMVDASVGGKTGINYSGLKNEIGVFAFPAAVIINTVFLKTLNSKNFMSGYAEMLKHALISNRSSLNRVLAFELSKINYEKLSALVSESVDVKREIVEADPLEKGLRKALNFGHTFGHAFESFMLAHQHPILHGHAVAWGLLCELYLSMQLCGFPKDDFLNTQYFIRDNYIPLPFSCKHYDELYEYMQHDKKNFGAEINFTLLNAVGDIALNRQTDRKKIFEALDYMQGLC